MQDYLPEAVADRTFYEPSSFGYEKRLTERMAWWAERRREAESTSSGAGQEATGRDAEPGAGREAREAGDPEPKNPSEADGVGGEE